MSSAEPMADAAAEAIDAAPIGSTAAPSADDTLTPPPADSTVADASAAAAPAAGTAAAPAPVAGAAQPARRFRGAGLAMARRVTRFAVAFALFAAGVALGVQFFVSNQPAAPAGPDPRVVTVQVPIVVAELASAIGANDTDGIQSLLTPEIFAAYTAEVTENEIGTVEAVDIVGSWVDGPRSANALVVLARNLEGNLIAMNLIVVTDGGPITGLR